MCNDIETTDTVKLSIVVFSLRSEIMIVSSSGEKIQQVHKDLVRPLARKFVSTVVRRRSCQTRNGEYPPNGRGAVKFGSRRNEP